MARASDTRDRLLRAASEVVRERGAGALTLDAVAEASGVSKGGLLYHFASKDALYGALLNRLLAETEREMAALEETDAGPEPGRFTRAFVRSSLAPGGAVPFGPALLAVAAASPDLLEAARTRYAAWQQRLDADGLPQPVATVARLAADGAFFADLLGLAPPDDSQRLAVEAFLARLCTPEEAEARAEGQRAEVREA